VALMIKAWKVTLYRRMDYSFSCTFKSCPNTSENMPFENWDRTASDCLQLYRNRQLRELLLNLLIFFLLIEGITPESTHFLLSYWQQPWMVHSHKQISHSDLQGHYVWQFYTAHNAWFGHQHIHDLKSPLRSSQSCHWPHNGSLYYSNLMNEAAFASLQAVMHRVCHLELP